jgi:hypothetical protein
VDGYSTANPDRPIFFHRRGIKWPLRSETLAAFLPCPCSSLPQSQPSSLPQSPPPLSTSREGLHGWSGLRGPATGERRGRRTAARAAGVAARRLEELLHRGAAREKDWRAPLSPPNCATAHRAG